MMKKYPITVAIIFPLILFIALPITCSYIRHMNDKVVKPITPRDLNGLDTLRANDSLYVIKFSIEKVIPDTIDNESQDKYEDYSDE